MLFIKGMAFGIIIACNIKYLHVFINNCMIIELVLL